MSWKNFVLPLLLLCLWGPCEEGPQACSCFRMHPQEAYCQADAVGKFQGTPLSIIFILFFYGSICICMTEFCSRMNFVPAPPDINCLVAYKAEKKNCFVRNRANDNKWIPKGADTDKAFSCISFPCCMTSLTECLWTDFLPGKLGNRDQAQNYACVKKSDGCCAWDRPAIYQPNGYPTLKEATVWV
uniref:Uncharacterized protein n=1 Tax=Hippocampus comes TaxID=109280 RepID=A0A3Q2ZGK9_HIPCM